MKRSDKTGGTRTFAYVVMPDHLHWLLQLRGGATLHNVVRHVKGCSARRINLGLNRNGPVWQAGFHDRALRKDESVEIAADYVVHNPVRAEICGRPEQYPLSGIVGAQRPIWGAALAPLDDRG